MVPALTMPAPLARVVLPLAASVPPTLLAAPSSATARSPTAAMRPASFARLPARMEALPPASMAPAELSSRPVMPRSRWAAPAVRSVPPWLDRLPAAMVVLPWLAMVPPSLRRAPATLMLVAPVPLCTIRPPFVLASWETSRASWPAIKLPASFTSVWPGWLLAVTVSVPGVTTVARLVVALPWVAATAMFAALLRLPERSTLAPCRRGVAGCEIRAVGDKGVARS